MKTEAEWADDVKRLLRAEMTRRGNYVFVATIGGEIVGSVSVKSANGDTRGFNPQNHEGVADDDMYLAVIHDMKFAPVQDEQLSKTLPTENQILSEFH